MTDAAVSEPARRGRPPLEKRMQVAPEVREEAPPAFQGKTLKFAWLSMDQDGETPPPQDGKWLWLSPDGGNRENGVEAYWKHTRRLDPTANGGRGGWVVSGWWVHRFPPGQPIAFTPAGWWPRNG